MSEEEYQRSLKAVVQKIRTAMTIKQSLERHIQLARKTGRSDLEIGDDIRKELRGQLPDDTIRKYLPASLKHQEFRNKQIGGNVPASSKQTHSINLPNIPPSPQVVKEAEYETVEVKATARTITAEDPELLEDKPPYEFRKLEEPQMGSIVAILDCNQFRSELRIATVNGDKVKLKINNNVVTAIL